MTTLVDDDLIMNLSLNQQKLKLTDFVELDQNGKITQSLRFQKNTNEKHQGHVNKKIQKLKNQYFSSVESVDKKLAKQQKQTRDLYLQQAKNMERQIIIENVQQYNNSLMFGKLSCDEVRLKNKNKAAKLIELF